jgi:hypothetical protein
MGLNASKVEYAGGNSGPREILEAGTYPGRLVQLVDLGVQEQKAFQGKEKPPVQMISVTYELAEEFMKDEDGNPIEDKPLWKSEDFALHPLQSEKAKSTVRYTAMDPDNKFGGDWEQLIGTPVDITFVVNKSKETGNEYNAISSVIRMRASKAEGMVELKNEPRIFNLDEPNMDVFEMLPEWLQKKIKGNLNYQGSALQDLLGEDNENNDDEWLWGDE